VSSFDDGGDSSAAGPLDSISQVRLLAADFRSGPQRSIHTAAEQQQHQVHLQQAIAARSSSATDPPAAAAAAAFDGGVSAAAVAAANEETSAVNRLDVYKAIGISGLACVLAGILDRDWVEAHQVGKQPTPHSA
jgi:hypothetical protein